MINLLPNDKKVQIKAARVNALLIKCLLVAFIAFLFLAGACGGTYYLISQNKSSSNNQTDNTNQEIIDADYSKAFASASLIDTNVTTIKNTLDSQIKFSKILLAIAANLPTGVTLNTFSIKSSDINSGTALQFSVHTAKSFDTATLSTDPGFQTNNPELFSEYKFISKELNSSDGTSTVNFSMKINYPRGIN